MEEDSSALSSVPSSPLSELSRSPSPPSENEHSLSSQKSYPTPLSSQDSSHNGSPSPDVMVDAAREDGPPPAKRRRMEPKPRTTLSLDLSSECPIDDQQLQLERLLKVLHKKRKIVVIAGAGISVSAGIPDFRSSTGLFKSLKSEHNLKSSGKDLFDASVYKDDVSTATFHAMVRSLSQATKTAEPTSFHHMLATLAHEGRLLRLYSQNVDGIDTALPPLATKVPLAREDGVWPKTVQLHGSLEKMVCVKCHALADFEAELFDGPVPPTCKSCEAQDNVRTEHAGKRSHGIGRLRPRMVLYNEHNPDEQAIGLITKADLRARPDALIIVGTTLKVPGVRRIAREMCSVVRDRRDGLTVWINNDNPPSGKDFEWDLIVKGQCDEVARHAAMRKWNDVFEEVTDEDMRKARETSDAKVVILSPAKPKTFEQVLGVPTPVGSPHFQPNTMETGPALEKKPSTVSLASIANAGEKKATAKTKPASGPKPAAPKRKRGPAKKPDEKNAKITFKIAKSVAPKSTIKLDAKVEGEVQPQRKPSQKRARGAQPKQPKAAPPTHPMETVWKLEYQPENVQPENVRPESADQDFIVKDILKGLNTTPIRPPSFSAPMTAVSPSDIRNNALSGHEPFPPLVSPLTAHRSKSVELHRPPESPTPIVARRSSAPIETISPTGYYPKDMEFALCF